MAKKKKKSFVEKKKGCEALHIGFPVFVVGLLLTAGFILYANGCFDGMMGMKYKAGDCLLNRAYEPVKVDYVYSSLEEYQLRFAKINTDQVVSGWYLTKDYDGIILNRTKKFVEETYTKIPCASKEIPDEN